MRNCNAGRTLHQKSIEEITQGHAPIFDKAQLRPPGKTSFETALCLLWGDFRAICTSLQRPQIGSRPRVRCAEPVRPAPGQRPASRPDTPYQKCMDPHAKCTYSRKPCTPPQCSRGRRYSRGNVSDNVILHQKRVYDVQFILMRFGVRVALEATGGG